MYQLIQNQIKLIIRCREQIFDKKGPHAILSQVLVATLSTELGCLICRLCDAIVDTNIYTSVSCIISVDTTNVLKCL